MALSVGVMVQVTANGGLRARTSPNGPQAEDAQGKAIVRPKGFRFTVTARRGGWARAKKLWYSEEYLEPITVPISTGKVSSPAPGYKVSTPWGKKPKDKTYWQARGHHTGRDYAAPSGAKCVAVVAGTVKYRWDKVLGHCALLQGKDSAGIKRTYWYCHLRAKPSTGSVKPGQTIGHVGQTGTGARGPHLHFERRTGYTTSWAGKDSDPTW
jgi:murein DD-endopeptidase MepM/ murein hydrolase activator NlpD